MKRLLLAIAAVAMILSGCHKFEEQINQVNNRVDNLEERVLTLEELCKQMNTNISSLQSLVKAVQQNDYVTGVTPITKNGEIIGYTISFTKSDPITIYHGKDGKDGTNGTDGKDGQNGQDGNDGVNGADGKDGHTPIIGVKQDSDGVYYWTVDGEWLLDASGNKIKAVGTDGKDGADGKDGQDGTNGKDGQDGADGSDGNDGATGPQGPQGPQGEQGVTPQLKIENDYWYISYDNGKSWTQLGKATGEQGPQGDKGDKGDVGLIGDSMFTDIDYTNDDYIVFTLSNGTEIKLPTWYAFEQLQKLCNQMNTNISSLQVIVAALQNNDYVQSIVPLMDNGKEVGYTITFTKSGAVNIYHGKDGKDGTNGSNGTDGKDGQDGENGTNGKDGHTPIIGVKQHTDGIYYWTIDGEWLLDNDGNKVKAVGTDGKDGANGTDGKDGQDGSNGNDGATGPQGPQGEQGVTPQLKIENGYWYVSYDNGSSWKQLGKATGEDGKDGQDGTNGTDGKDGADGKDGVDGKDGDSFFQSVDTSNSDYVILTLADGTEIKLPTWYAFEQLQKLCNQMNTNISSLQVIVAALQNNDYVQSIVPLMDNGKEVGYTITFTKSGAVNIYHGKDGKDGTNGSNGTDGKDGQDGENGTNGKDGHTPIIGVKQHTDGIYYWTIDGEWLLDNDGNKVKAVGTDGKDGANGTDGKDGQDGSNGNDGATGPQGPQGEQGVTPQLKIENGYWYVSYDNGSSWKQLGKATGEDGKDGQDGTNGTNGTDGKDGADGKDGDSFFKSVTEDENNVYITLTDGTTFTLPKTSGYLFNRLQSVSYVPKYSDGKATVIDDKVEMDFQISPKNAVKDIAANWQSILSLKAIYTITRAVSFIDMPILSCEADETNGVITITASAENLSEEFFVGTQEASITLMLSDGNNEITSGYIPLAANYPKDNEIWYTATKKVTPNCPSNNSFDSFGANIVSHEWESLSGKGVIKFNANVTRIGEYAMYDEQIFEDMDNLQSIILPNSVALIDSCAFMGCDNLQSVTIGNNVTSIGSSAFSGCNSLQSIKIPNSVTSIAMYAFSNCALQNITIGNGLKSIGRFAFEGCSIQNVYLTDIAAWCEISFYSNESSNPLREANLYVNGILVTNLVVPDNVEKITDFAFSGCKSLQKVTISNGAIGKEAFYNCPNLQQVTINNGVTSIGYRAFCACRNLKEVYCESITPPTASLSDSYWSGFTNASSNLLIYVPTESVDTYKARNGWKEFKNKIVAYDFETPPNNEIWYTTSDGKILDLVRYGGFGANAKTHTYENGRGILSFDGDVTSIGETFTYYKKLTNIRLPQSVVSISDFAFSYTSLTDVTIPENVKEIGILVFGDCLSLSKFEGNFASSDGRCLIVDRIAKAFAPAGLTAYTIPDCTTIAEGTFADCPNIINITIPKSVSYIENSAFYGCLSLLNVYCEATTPPTAVLFNRQWEAFNDNAQGRKIYVPSQSVDAYKAADGWKEYADSIVGYNF